MEAAFHDPSVMDMPVEKVMGPRLPTIGVGQPIARAVAILERSPALLVLAGGRPLAVLTRTDLLGFLSTGAGAGPLLTGPAPQSASGSVAYPVQGAQGGTK